MSAFQTLGANRSTTHLGPAQATELMVEVRRHVVLPTRPAPDPAGQGERNPGGELPWQWPLTPQPKSRKFSGFPTVAAAIAAAPSWPKEPPPRLVRSFVVFSLASPGLAVLALFSPPPSPTGRRRRALREGHDVSSNCRGASCRPARTALSTSLALCFPFTETAPPSSAPASTSAPAGPSP